MSKTGRAANAPAAAAVSTSRLFGAAAACWLLRAVVCRRRRYEYDRRANCDPSIPVSDTRTNGKSGSHGWLRTVQPSASRGRDRTMPEFPLTRPTQVRQPRVQHRGWGASAFESRRRAVNRGCARRRPPRTKGVLRFRGDCVKTTPAGEACWAPRRIEGMSC